MKLLVLLCVAWLPVAWSRSPLTRVIDGVDTTIELNRHQLSLRVSGVHSCGASLISSTRGVTTAHCLGLSVVVYSVLAGSTDRTNTACDTCVVRNLIGYTRHPNYVDDALRGYPNDVAVISFTAIGSNGGIGYIAMATNLDGDFAGESCSVTGWGLTSTGGTQAVVLQEAIMTVMNNAACSAAWPTTPITDGQLCMTSASSSACAGDNGGPLVCRNKLVGAMSWVSSNCNPSLPSVFTRISAYKSWIDGQLL